MWEQSSTGVPSLRFGDSSGRQILPFLLREAVAAQPVAAAPAAQAGVSPIPASSPQPTSFADGRYQVKKFLGEGGKKLVYLALDTKLDRDVAFALIKTDGLDETSRIRIQREAQAMGQASTPI